MYIVHSFFTLLRVRFLYSHNIKAVVFMVFNVNDLFFTQRLLTTTVVYSKLMLSFLTFCSFILLTEYSLDLLLVNFISGRTIGLCMDVEWWMASNCLPRA